MRNAYHSLQSKENPCNMDLPMGFSKRPVSQENYDEQWKKIIDVGRDFPQPKWKHYNFQNEAILGPCLEDDK